MAWQQEEKRARHNNSIMQPNMTQDTDHLETIMAQTMSAKPLETLQHRLLDRLQTLILIPLVLAATTYQRRVRAAWRVLQGREAYHGAALLLSGEDSIPWQWRLAAAVGGSDRALLLQKFEQWIQYNKGKGRAATTHNGYSAWISEHFGHLNEAGIGRHVRALEKMGVLITQRVGWTDPGKPYDQRKSYRIDYGRLNALVSKVKSAESPMKSGESETKTSNSKAKTRDSNLNNDSKSPNQRNNQSLKHKSETQEPTKQRGGRRAGAGRKPKQTEALIEPIAASTVAEFATVEALPPAAPIEDSPIPNSADPLPHADAALIARLVDHGVDEPKAAALIERYSADRVRAVLHECERRQKSERGQKIENPPGWIIAELKHDIFKLGSMTEGECGQTLSGWLRRAAAQEWSFEYMDEDLSPDSDSHSLNDAPLPEPVPPDPAAVARWCEALKVLEESMPSIGPAVFFNTVNDSELIRFDAEGSVYVVRAQTRDHAQRSRFHIPMILEALESVHGGSCRVEFEVMR